MIVLSAAYPAPTHKGAWVVKVQSVFPASSQTVWQKLLQPATLQFIASPLLKFTPQGRATLPNNWQEGTTIMLRLYAFGILPLGKHSITITHIDPQNQTLQTTESGAMASVWQHRITLQTQQPGQTLYTDEILMYSGYLTRMMARWALWFYRHRQKRWLKLLPTT